MQKQRTPVDKVIAIMHFPPFNGRREESEFTRLFVANDISTVVYGHLHGKECRADEFITKFGIDFWLTSADIVNFRLIEIDF